MTNFFHNIYIYIYFFKLQFLVLKISFCLYVSYLNQSFFFFFFFSLLPPIAYWYLQHRLVIKNSGPLFSLFTSIIDEFNCESRTWNSLQSWSWNSCLCQEVQSSIFGSDTYKTDFDIFLKKFKIEDLNSILSLDYTLFCLLE